MPLSSAYPIAAGVPDSGTGMTRSASTGYSRASRRPMSTRTVCTRWSFMSVSGRARYTNSKRQCLGAGSAKWRLRRPSSSTAMSSPGSTSRMYDAPTMSRAAVSDEATEHERPDALGVPGGIEGVLVHPHEGERASDRGQHLDGVLLEALVGVVGEERGDQAGVVGGLQAAGREVELAVEVRQVRNPLRELAGVGQVAVVGECDRALRGGPEGRLGVVPGARAGRGVAGVADGEVALERGERALVEDLRDQAHVLEDEDLPAVAHRHPGGLLPAVLE